MTLKIGIDVDDVLAAFQKGWLKYYNSLYGTNIQFEDIKSYEYDLNLFNVDNVDVIFERVHDFYVSSDFDLLETIEYSEESISQIAQHDLYVITSRNEIMRDKTISWIEKFFGNKFKGIILTNQFSINSEFQISKKEDIAKSLELDFIVEDALHHAEKISQVGTKVLLLDKPWNRSSNGSNINISRVKDWREIVPLINN